MLLIKMCARSGDKLELLVELAEWSLRFSHGSGADTDSSFRVMDRELARLVGCHIAYISLQGVDLQLVSKCGAHLKLYSYYNGTSSLDNWILFLRDQDIYCDHKKKLRIEFDN